MIFTNSPLPVPGDVCRRFGHTNIRLYSRSWRSLFRRKEREVCVTCDPEFLIPSVFQLYQKAWRSLERPQ